MFRPIAAIFRLLQFCSKSVLYIVYVYTTQYTHTHIYIHIYMYICVCVFTAWYRHINIHHEHMTLFEQNCNNMKVAAIGRNM